VAVGAHGEPVLLRGISVLVAHGAASLFTPPVMQRVPTGDALSAHHGGAPRGLTYCRKVAALISTMLSDFCRPASNNYFVRQLCAGNFQDADDEDIAADVRNIQLVRAKSSVP
jgi:hypothetical protein